MLPFKETNFAFVHNLGRPRTAVFVGRGVAESASFLVERGTKVVALEGSTELVPRAADLAQEAHGVDLEASPLTKLGKRRFDLIAIEDARGAWLSPDFMSAVKDHLVDGGHVVASAAATSLSRAELEGALANAGLEILRYDLNPRVLRGVFSGTAKAVDDLRIAHTTSFRYTRDLIRPLERLVAMRAPDTLAVDHIVVARVPPRKGPLSLTIGMLTLNEHESVERMIDDIRAVAPDASILLIDSSSDETPELAKAKGARVVRQLPPQGHGPAMERLMYEAAQDSEALIYLDCDFTYPTNMIPDIRKLLEEGADVVNASRTAKYPKAMPIPNFLANRFFAASAHLVHGVPTTDVHSGLRGYRSSVVRAFSFDGAGDALPLDTLILPARSRYRTIEFPIEYKERVGVSKLAKLRGTVWTFLRIASAVGEGERVGSTTHFEVRH